MGAYGPGPRFVTVLDSALPPLDRDLDRLAESLHWVTREPSFACLALRFVGLEHIALPDPDAISLASKLQRLPRWLGVRRGIAILLWQFLGRLVEVVGSLGPLLSLPRSLRAPLGGRSARLGESVSLGPAFVGPAPTLLARIGPVPLVVDVALDRDAAWRAELEELLTTCAPAATEHGDELVLRVEDRRTVLGDRWHA